LYINSELNQILILIPHHNFLIQHYAPEATLKPICFQFKAVIGNVVVTQVCWEAVPNTTV